MKRAYLAAFAAAAALGTLPAHAVTFVPVNGSALSYLASVPGAQFTFETPGAPAGFTQVLTGTAAVRNFDDSNGAKPAFDTSANYLTVTSGSSATLAAVGSQFRAISLFAGSLDALNTLELLGLNGLPIATYSGTQLAAAPPGANGDQDAAQTNRFLTFFAGANEVFTGVRMTSGVNSFEVDNVRFAAAVPEPATWLMLLFGFGFIGLTMRSRRRNTSVVYA